MSMQYPRSHTLISSDFINIVKYKLIGSPTNPVNLELRSNLKKVGIITPAVNMMTAKRKSIWITWTFANLSLQKMTKVSDFLAVFCSLGKFQFQICWWQAADLNLYQYEILFFFLPVCTMYYDDWCKNNFKKVWLSPKIDKNDCSICFCHCYWCKIEMHIWKK